MIYSSGLLFEAPLIVFLGWWTGALIICLRLVHTALNFTLNVNDRSRLFAKCVTRMPHSELRSDFRSRSMNLRRPVDGNPHAEMAASRSTADDFISNFAAANGLPVYSVSSSPKDAWKGVAGSRFYYFEKDLRMDYRNDPKPDNHLLKMIDVDYYVDKETLLAHIDDSRCACFYTIMPDSLASCTTESTFLIDADGVVTESHAGSTPYQHKLWNWRIDYITSSRFEWNGLVPTFVFRHYYVEMRRVGVNRYVVCLVPSLTGGFLAHLVWHYLNPEKEPIRSLERWRPQHVNGVNVLVSPTVVLVAYPKSTRQFKLTHEQFGEICHAPKLSGAGVQRIINSSESQYELATIGNLLNSVQVCMNPQVYDYRDPRSYKLEYSDVQDDQSKVKGQHICKPLMDGAFVPASCLSNDLGCVDGRLTKLQSPSKAVPAKYYDYLTEFVSCFEWVPPHSLHPLDEDAVIERASSVQKNKYHNAQMEPQSRLRNKAFQKTEAYPDPKDPRNISAVDPKHVLQASCYTHVFVDYLKSYVPWYAFGLAPDTMAESVSTIIKDGDGELVETDFSRYDGTQTSFDVDVNTAVMLQLFHPTHHDKIRSLRYELSYSTFTTEHGVTYCTYDTNKSGCADTSKDNTVLHGFCQFCHFRNEGFDKKQAWIKIGLCGGDDGLFRTRNPKGYEKTCLDLGKILKSNIRHPGEPVSFLGRIWSDWNSSASFFDPYRCLSKFHFSDNSDRRISSELLAWRKAVGYYVTDNGNFVGHIAQRFLEITGKGKTELVERREWLRGPLEENTKYTTDQIKDKFQGQPIFPGVASHPRTLRLVDDHQENGETDPCFKMFCSQMSEHGVTESQILAWYNDVMTAESLDDMPTLHVVPVEAPKIAMTVDGLTIGPPMTPAPRQPTVVAPICAFLFTKKKCSRGDKCKFSHDLKNCCHDFLKNKCVRPKCRKPHIPLSASL